jgi:hypothetical protein
VTLLQRTSQSWKVYLFVILLIMGAGMSLCQGFLYGPLGKELAMKVALAGSGLVVIAFIWTALAVRCPKCQLKLFMHAIRFEGFFRWFAWLLQVEACPKCGHGAAPPTQMTRKKVKGLRP